MAGKNHNKFYSNDMKYNDSRNGDFEDKTSINNGIGADDKPDIDNRTNFNDENEIGGDFYEAQNAAYDAGYRAALEEMQGRRNRRGAAYGSSGIKKRRHPVRNALIILLVMLLLAGSAVGTVSYLLLGRMLEQSIDQDFRHTTQVLNSGITYDESMMGTKSIALVGLDSRDGNLLEGNSDTMIVATIDNRHRTLKMFSIYRDTYLDVKVGEAVYRKANYAYAVGGPKLMVNMINRNLDLNITDYLTVDFKALQVVIDDLGGIDVTMTDKEVEWMNDNGWETAEVCGVTWYYVEPGKGTYHLNGVQAVSYARIRKTIGNDFKRTSRQRLVISKLADRARKAGPAALFKAAQDVFPLISTSLTENELLQLALGVLFYKTDSTQGFPFVHLESDVDGMDVVVPVTLKHNVKELHRWLFGVDDYEPSKTVNDISNHIISMSGFDESDIDRAADYSFTDANPDSGSEADGH